MIHRALWNDRFDFVESSVYYMYEESRKFHFSYQNIYAE